MPTSPAQSHVSKLRWLYPLALAATVVIASGRGEVAAPSVVNFDKIAHFGVFGLLATLIARSPGVRRFRHAILLGSIFGICDEFRQSFTPGRSVEFADWMADTLGAATAVTLYAFWPWYRRLLEFPLRLRRAVPATTNVAAPLATDAASADAQTASAA
jgi:Predicted integral membrane protein